MNDENKPWYSVGGRIPPAGENGKQVRCDRPGCPMCNPEPAHRAHTWPDLDLTEFPPAVVLFAAFAGGTVFGVLVMVVVAAGNGWLG